MSLAASPGCATKMSSAAIELPGVGPEAHVVPAVLVWTAGTKIRYRPSVSAYRYGASRVTGLVASVVYGPPHGAWAGKHCAGAFTTPEKTWFQTPLVQPSISLLRTSHCCCDPFTIVAPLNCESAMNPPLANDGPVQ